MKKALYLFLVTIQFALAAHNALAGNRFTSNYSCSDAVKTCVSSGIRKVDGFDVHKDCWEWSYSKTCNYPSKNDCRLYAHCYAVADLECLLKDSLGNCVNLKREFSCKSWEKSTKEDKEARVDLIEKDGDDSLVCKGVPCIDGNCVDKSYLTNGEMMDSVSKLYMASNMKPDKDYNFNLFPGFGSHCSKKAAGYSNCCPNTAKGWGKQLGAKCTKDEQSLMTLRSKNLCIYVGKENKQKMGVKTIVKHHFCCFGNMLEKVVQVEGRKQLGINFGSGGSPNCRGLTLDEIQKLDFSKMDFSEFINELMIKFTGTYKTPNPKEIGDTIENHLNIRKYDDNENNPDNRFTGLNGNVKDDSWEAEEERKKQETEQGKNRRKVAKEQELSIAKDNLTQSFKEREIAIKPFYVKDKWNDGYIVRVDSPYYPEYKRKEDLFRAAQARVKQIEQELQQGNY
jgi:hypothetical protein